MGVDGFRADDQATDGSGLSVLCIDPDEAVLEDIAAAFESTDGITVQTTADAEDAYEFVRRADPDCIVVECGIPDIEWGWLDDAVAAPVVLYTKEDLTAVETDVLEAADTFVQKQSTGEGHRLLLEKVRGTVESHDEVPSRALSDAAGELAADFDPLTGLFLVGDDGEMEWAGTRFEEVFPVDEVSGRVPDTEDFHRRLAAVLDDDPELTREVLDGDRQVFGVPPEDPSACYRHATRPADEQADGERFHVFQEVTAAVERYDDADLFERFVENVREGLYVLDADAKLVYCNEAYAEMFGYDREELLGEHAARWMASGELRKGQQALERLLDADTDSHVVDLEFRTKSGEHITRSVHFTIRDRDDGYEGLLGVVRRPSEVTDTAEAFERYRPLVEGVDVAKLVVDDDGVVRICNEPARHVLGVSPGDIRNNSLRGALSGTPGGRELASELRSALSDPGHAGSWVTDVGASVERYEVTVDALAAEGERVGGLVTLRPTAARDTDE